MTCFVSLLLTMSCLSSLTFMYEMEAAEFWFFSGRYSILVTGPVIYLISERTSRRKFRHEILHDTEEETWEHYCKGDTDAGQLSSNGYRTISDFRNAVRWIKNFFFSVSIVGNLKLLPREPTLCSFCVSWVASTITVWLFFFKCINL
jgi:hypothetical protein